MGKLTNKIAIVTGGAGAGIGGAVSSLFAAEGATVVIFDIDRARGLHLVEDITARGGKVYFVHADVGLPAEVHDAVSEVLDHHKSIDILVNNVGGSYGVTLDDIDETIIDKNIRSNLTSALICTKQVLPTMVAQGSGSVIFVSSINALLGGFSEVVYSAAKAGIHAVARSLTADYGTLGVRFNVVCPGTILSDGGVWKERELDVPGLRERLASLYPLRRNGTPRDVANGILYLASEDASWVSGIVLPIDGGLTATGALPGRKWWEQL